MKLNSVPMLEVVQELGVRTKGNRFHHHCRDMDGQASRNADAQMYEDNTFYCFRCSNHGNNTSLIMDAKGYETEREANQWAVDTMNGVDPMEGYTQSYDAYLVSLRTIYQASLAEMQQDTEAQAFIQTKWGLTPDDINKFGLGRVTKEHLALVSESTVKQYHLASLVDRIIIPWVDNGVLVGLKGRKIDAYHAEEAIKYINISNKDKYPLPVFGYTVAEKALKRGQNKNNTLLVVESEMDALVARKKLGDDTAIVAVSSANIHTEYQVQGIKDLSTMASGVVILFDTDDADDKKNVGYRGAKTLATKLLTKGVDPFIYRLPLPEGKTKNDLAEYLKADTSEVELTTCIGEMFYHQNRVLQQMIEDSRLSLQKTGVLDTLVDYIANQPQVRRELYITQLHETPKTSEYKGLANHVLNQCRVDRKMTLALVNKVVARNNATKKTDFSLSDNDDDAAYSGFAQAYYQKVDDPVFYARKTIYAGVTLTVDGTQVNQRCAVLVEAQGHPSGNTTMDFKTLEPEALDDVQKILLPPDDIDPTRIQWQTTGNSSYGFRNFFAKKGQVAVEGADIYNELVALFTDYVYLREPHYAMLLAGYVMMTYCHKMFESVPYLHIRGEAGSGKSLIGEMLHTLCFNSEKMVSANAPHIFRLSHSKACTIIIGEAEYLREDTPRGSEMLEILKETYSSSGGTVPRLSQNKAGAFDITRFNAFVPKIMIGTKTIDSILDTRCLKIKTIKAPIDVMHQLKLYQRDKVLLSPKLQELRNKLMVWSLTKYVHVFQAYHTAMSDLISAGVNNRDLELWTPIYAVVASSGMGEEALRIIVEQSQRTSQDRIEAMSHSDYAQMVQMFDMMMSTAIRDNDFMDKYEGLPWAVHIKKQGTSEPILMISKERLINHFHKVMEGNCKSNKLVDFDNQHRKTKPKWMTYLLTGNYPVLRQAKINRKIEELGYAPNTYGHLLTYDVTQLELLKSYLHISIKEQTEDDNEDDTCISFK